MNLPSYVFKMPEEGTWLALGTGIGVLVAAALAEFTQVSGTFIGSVSAIVPLLFRFFYGMFSPNPTVTEEIASVREALGDKPGA